MENKETELENGKNRKNNSRINSHKVLPPWSLFCVSCGHKYGTSALHFTLLWEYAPVEQKSLSVLCFSPRGQQEEHIGPKSLVWVHVESEQKTPHLKYTVFQTPAWFVSKVCSREGSCRAFFILCSLPGSRPVFLSWCCRQSPGSNAGGWTRHVNILK